MRELVVSDREYSKLIKRLEAINSTRNSLLTFSFTAVLTVLGIAIADDVDSISAWLCLIPFLLIIPFTARISYYRLASAHINSFLKKFAKEDMAFEIGSGTVTENKCKHYKYISWLINHEMVLLGLASGCVFYFKYIRSVSNWRFWNFVSLVFPLLLIFAVFLLADSTYNYKKLMDSFSSSWDTYADDIV